MVKDQEISAARAKKMMENSRLCKGDLRYIIEHVSGPGAEEVGKEAKRRLPKTPEFGELPVPQGAF